jgi:hypothetical protein
MHMCNHWTYLSRVLLGFLSDSRVAEGGLVAADHVTLILEVVGVVDTAVNTAVRRLASLFDLLECSVLRQPEVSPGEASLTS